MKKFQFRRRDRRGLTLVEVLVVIAVIGILGGLLLPAVMSARSSGRRSQCANNLRQLGSAVQQFHERNGTLPVYWGAMKGRPGEPFGGWLLHILPDLGEQVFFDSLPVSGSSAAVETSITIRGAMIADQIPASPDFKEGEWKTSVVEVINMAGGSVNVEKTELVGRVGTPAQGPWYAYSRTITGTVFNTAGVPVDFYQAQSKKSLNVLQCSDDISTPPNWMQKARGNQEWSLTNYMANAHVFLRFGLDSLPPNPNRQYSFRDQTYSSPGMGGRWKRTVASGNFNLPNNNRRYWDHEISLNGGDAYGKPGGLGTNPRQFAHVIDGLSNTIMFGEGMRRCDANPASGRGITGRFRYAFLPTSTDPPGEEHAFGIDPAVSGTSANLNRNSYAGFGGYGNTIMFQQRPPPEGCNYFRLQANHEVLNVVMCDGSVRGISPRVTRREQVDPDVAGREFGRLTYSPEALGGVVGDGQLNNIRDGIWDMLMVPDDPPSNVLSNTGEVGKEK
jgi:prepilin-type N-terminal cleavage/methylation domain-containing protein